VPTLSQRRKNSQADSCIAFFAAATASAANNLHSSSCKPSDFPRLIAPWYALEWMHFHVILTAVLLAFSSRTFSCFAGRAVEEAFLLAFELVFSVCLLLAIALVGSPCFLLAFELVGSSCFLLAFDLVRSSWL